MDYVRLADATAEPEVLGLIASAPGLRPADVLTPALATGLDTAVDVGIASPDAAGAGEDCCETMRRNEVVRYGPHERELAAEGISIKPAYCFSDAVTDDIDYFRVGFGEEKMPAALEAFAAFVEKRKDAWRRGMRASAKQERRSRL